MLGAIFADAGFEAARDVVRRFWEPLSGRARGSPRPTRNPCCRNGRKAAACRCRAISRLTREGPDHAPRFTAEVQIDGVAPERGQGANKRAAEQAAALAMLLREGVWQAPHDG